ncbi:MAG: DUF2185 domain-containing protein [Lachnospiraceae bacterium]|nr:DUF2185 domain-containing protein [Lachnospiraceae bacterium]
MGLFNKKKKEAAARQTETGRAKTEQNGADQGAFSQTKTHQSGTKQKEIKQYIKETSGTIVSKSILEGTSKLKWLFRQESGEGWIAFGDCDTQEYVDNPENMAVVDFNVLANIEPAAANVFYLPPGADLEFCSDETGKYFIDTRTGEEFREKVENPLQIAFERNMKFLNKESYPEEFFQELFGEKENQELFVLGEADFPTGEIVLADPLAYLGTKYMITLEKQIPPGSYPVELAICRSEIAGLRIAAARLKISGQRAVRHEIAMPKGNNVEDLGKSGVWGFFGVDTGMACFTDLKTAGAYHGFIQDWQKKHPGKNRYVDYFAAFFQESYQKYPDVQREGGDFLLWQVPGASDRLAMFASGMGDGIYSGYWGMDAEGNPVELVIPFINPLYI